MTQERIQQTAPEQQNTASQWQPTLDREATDDRLRVQRPDDRYEQEARTAADAASTTPPVKPMSATANDRGGAASVNLPGGGGQALPGDLQQTFGSQFQHDFSGVRVYNNAQSSQTARRLGARAFTHGQAIHFAQGQYQPDYPQGQNLLAHELAHTIQQGDTTGVIQRQEDTRVADPMTQARDEDSPDATSISSTADAIVTAIRNEGTASRARITRRLAMLPPTERDLVLRQTRAQLSPPEQTILEDILRGVERADEEMEQVREATREPSRTQTEAEGTSQAPSAERQQAQAQADAQTQREVEQVPQPEESVAAQAGEQTQEQQAENADEMQEEQEDAQEGAEEQTEEAQDTSQEETEEAQEGTGEGEVEGDDSEPTSLFDFVEAEQGGPEPASTEEAQAELGDYDPAAARADAQVAAANVRASGDAAVSQISGAAAGAREQLTATADATRAQVNTMVSAHIAAITATYDQKRKEIEGKFDTLHTNVTKEHETRQKTLIESGDTARTDLGTLFSDHRTNISTAVTDKVEAAGDLRTTKEETVRNRTERDAERARTMGRNKAQSYGSSERERVKANAARSVANRTAKEIESNEPEAVEAIQDLTQDLPEEIRAKGDEALNGFDGGLPDLQQQISDFEAGISTQFTSQLDSATQKIDSQKQSMLAQLDAARAAAISAASLIIPQAEAQIQAALQKGLAALGTGPGQAIARIQQTVSEAETLLTQSDTPDSSAIQDIEGRVTAFAADASSAAIQSMNQGVARLTAKFSDMVGKTAEGITTAQQKMTEDLAAATTQADDTTKQIEDKLSEEFDKTATSFDDGVSEGLGQVETELATKLSEAIAEMQTPIDDAEAKIDEAINDGFAKNNEALQDLPAQMREAASDAAWDYDHPILSTIASVAAIVAGVIAGILVVIALVVVVIVAFKVIVAGLVILGFSKLVATIIVTVALLAYTAYSVYSAYQRTGSMGGVLAEMTGIENISNAFTQEGLSPFERGYEFGKGIATVATFFIGRGMGRSVNARFARVGRIPNPSGRMARLMRFIERPRALTRTGRRLFIRFGGRRADVALRGAGQRIGGAINRVGERLGGTRLGSRLQAAGRRIDDAVEGGFRGVERGAQRVGEGARSLFGRPSTPAPATPAPVAPSPAVAAPAPARPAAQRGAPSGAASEAPSNVHQMPRPGEPGGPTPPGQGPRQPRDADVIPIDRGRRGPRPSEPEPTPPRAANDNAELPQAANDNAIPLAEPEVMPRRVVRDATTGRPINTPDEFVSPSAASPSAGTAGRPRAMASANGGGSGGSRGGGGNTPRTSTPAAPSSGGGGTTPPRRPPRGPAARRRYPDRPATGTRSGYQSNRPPEPEVIQTRGRGGQHPPEVDEGLVREIQAARRAQSRAASSISDDPVAHAGESGKTFGVAERQVAPGVRRRTRTATPHDDPTPQAPVSRVTRPQVRSHLDQMRERGMDFQFDMDRLMTHAEVKNIIRNPNTPVGVNRPMCRSCQDFFSAEAMFRGRRQIVADPQVTRVFEPSGNIIEYWNDGTIVRFEQRIVPGARGGSTFERIRQLVFPSGE